MVVPHVEGFDALAQARRRLSNRIVCAHPALASPLFSPGVGMVALPRMAGADVLVLPSPFGPLFTHKNFCDELVREVSGTHLPTPPPLPVFGGGVDDVAARRLVSRFGSSIGVAVGASLLRNPAALGDRVRRLQDALRETSERSVDQATSPSHEKPPHGG
jgi:ribulose 1,5-bisphosphate carboxylase large subunit-like protein